MKNINALLEKDPLVQLIQEEQFIGWTFRIDYETAIVLTNDLWKFRAKGVPHNCFLLATALDPKRVVGAREVDREVVLLRVVGSAALPMDDKLIQAKIENLKDRTSTSVGRELDDLTKGELQFGGLECRILGTFFSYEGELRLGSDIESYFNAAQLNVYRPKGSALETIVNYVSPERVAAAREEAERLGLAGALPTFPIGTVRYTSTDRLHRGEENDKVIFKLNAIDFLARRTAVFGMTRTGKSNMVKQLVSVVMRTSTDCGLKIGQIIYDLNGEYANANQQDKGSLAEVYPNDAVRYRMLPMKGFQPLLNNFFTQVAEGHATLRSLIENNKISSSADIEAFLSISFEQPERSDFDQESEWRRQHARFQRKIAAYQTLLARAGFEPPKGFKIIFDANKEVREHVDSKADPKIGLTPEEALAWFSKAREKQNLLISSGGEPWIDPDTKALLNLLVQKNDNGAYISGFRLLQPFKDYHSPQRSSDVSEEIYSHLCRGRIIILDLSVGDPFQRERLAKRIAQYIFQSSMKIFNESLALLHGTWG
jgi:hypothetical protein